MYIKLYTKIANLQSFLLAPYMVVVYIGYNIICLAVKFVVWLPAVNFEELGKQVKCQQIKLALQVYILLEICYMIHKYSKGYRTVENFERIKYRIAGNSQGTKFPMITSFQPFEVQALLLIIIILKDKSKSTKPQNFCPSKISSYTI